MTRTELAGKTVAALKIMAKRSKIALPAGAKKDDIIDALLKGRKTVSRTGTVAKKTAKAGARTSARSGAGTAAAAAGKPGKRGAKSAAKKTDGKRAVPKKATAGKGASAAAMPREWRSPSELASQEEIEGAKFFTGISGRGQGIAPFLPSEYGEDRIVILARDPETLFGYWEVTPKRLERERRTAGADSRLCIRVYDVTGVSWDGSNATSFFDQDIYERVGSWYFALKRPAHAFCAEIGLRASDGRFRGIARSARVVMPADSVSDILDEEWTLLDEEFAKLYGIHIGPSSGLSSADVQELIRQRRGMGLSSPGAR